MCSLVEVSYYHSVVRKNEVQLQCIWCWKCHHNETCDLDFMLFAVSLTTTGLQAMLPFLPSGGISPRSWSCELHPRSNLLGMMYTALIFIGCVYQQEEHHYQERVTLRIPTLLGVPKRFPALFFGSRWSCMFFANETRLVCLKVNQILI